MLLTAFVIFFLIFLASFQIAFINRFAWGFNIFLVLILFLIFTKHIYGAIFLGWFGGLLIDTANFATFGVTSLTLLLTTYFLIIFQKKALLTGKVEGILIIGATSVLFYHSGQWLINNILSFGLENFSFYFLNGGILAELLLTTMLFLLIYKSRYGLDA